MSKLIKHAMISWPLATLKNKNLHLTNKKNQNVFLNYLNKITKRNTTTLPFHTKLKYCNCWNSISCFGRRGSGRTRAGDSDQLSDTGRARAYILGCAGLYRVCVCVCATHVVRRSEWYGCAWNTKWRRDRIEFRTLRSAVIVVMLN